MTCRDYDVLVSLRAADALDAGDAARLESHLAGCAACRTEAGDLAAALALAKLPPPSDAERRAFQDLGDRTLAAYRRSSRVRSLVKRVAAVAMAAAAAAAVLLAPAVVHRRPAVPAPTPAAAPSQVAAWEQPDLDTLWSDSSVLDPDASAVTNAADTGQEYDDPYAGAVLAAVE